MLRRSLVSLALLLPALFMSPLVQAAGMTGTTITRSATAGGYKLTLQIGPAESMMMNKKGPAAMCAMKGGMQMRPVARMPVCNHHLELHVYNANTGKVVTGVHVMIQVTGGKHVSMMVPVDTMDSGQNFHYGNNVYLAAGGYTVSVHVNMIGTSFSVKLM